MSAKTRKVSEDAAETVLKEEGEAVAKSRAQIPGTGNPLDIDLLAEFRSSVLKAAKETFGENADGESPVQVILVDRTRFLPNRFEAVPREGLGNVHRIVQFNLKQAMFDLEGIEGNIQPILDGEK